MKKIVVSLFVLSAAVVSQSSMAREFAEIYTECGLGAMIAPKHEAVAAVTNVTWDLGTTAVSSNISSPDTCQGGKTKTAAFIHDSYEHIEKDLAVGNGSYLSSLLALSGCQGEARAAIGSGLRSDFSTLVANPAYPNMTRLERASDLYDAYQARIAEFAGSCSIG